MGKTGYTILGILDKKTRLVADSHSFVIQEMIKTKDGYIWVGKWFYSWLGDAIKGYIKHKARTSNKNVINSKPLLDIIDLIDSLEKTIKEVGDSLSKQFAIIRNDPVEKAIRDAT